MLEKIEGFQYTKPWGLKMGYHHLLIMKNTSSLCTKILPWGK